MGFRLWIGPLFLLSVGICVVFISTNLSKDKKASAKNKNNNSVKEEMSFFKNLNHFILKLGKKHINLIADEAGIKHIAGEVSLVSPKGVIYIKNNNIPVNYKANAGILNTKEENIYLNNKVVLTHLSKKINSEFANYQSKTEIFTATVDVKSKAIDDKTKDKIYVDSDKMKFWPFLEKSYYFGNVKGKLIRKRPFEPGMRFSSDEMWAFSKTHKIELTGNVFLKKQEVTSNSLRGEIFLENYNKSLKYYVLYDDVVVKENVLLPDGQSFVRKSYSEKVEGVASEDIVILTGYPKVYQQGDVIKGNKITLRQNNEVVEVDDSHSSLIIKD